MNAVDAVNLAQQRANLSGRVWYVVAVGNSLMVTEQRHTWGTILERVKPEVSDARTRGV